MSAGLAIKLLIYRTSSSKIGRKMLNLLSFGLSVNCLDGKHKPKNHKFIVAITTDTESGYVEDNEKRVWQIENPKAYQGYYYGMRNLLKIFSRNKVKTTFFISTNCFSSKGRELKLIKKEFGNLIKNKHEIGLHMHPDSDLALQQKLSRKFPATSAFFYDYGEKLELVSAAKKIIGENLGISAEKNLVSFRWGNWAMDTDGAKAIGEFGFKIDSSAVPGIKGHSDDTMRYDWSKVSMHYQWKLSTLEYQSISHNSSVTEIPIATFSFFWVKMRADPVNSVFLEKAFLEYYNNADRSKKPFVFVVITHSSEATKKDGSSTQVCTDLERFIEFAKKYKDVEFATLKTAGKL
ncbi:MAG TPA: hypothetical protein VJI97_01550 [Candidatus Nanoarchaeia archaeon]|nr:hypothetical protein [Candidatus Nanoarchaeia archaeon]